MLYRKSVSNLGNAGLLEIQLKESGIPLTIGIQNTTSTGKLRFDSFIFFNPKSTAWNEESKSTFLDSPTLAIAESGGNTNNFQKLIQPLLHQSSQELIQFYSIIFDNYSSSLNRLLVNSP